MNIFKDTRKAFGVDLDAAKKTERKKAINEFMTKAWKGTSIKKAVKTSLLIAGAAFAVATGPTILETGKSYARVIAIESIRSNAEKEILRDAVIAAEPVKTKQDLLFLEVRDASLKSKVLITKSRADILVKKTAAAMKEKEIKDVETAVKSTEKVMKIDEETALKLTISGYSNYPEITAKLIGALDSKSWEVRRMSALALGVNKEKSAVSILVVKMLNDEDPDVRAAIAFALGEICDSYAVAALIDRLQNDKYSVVQLRSAESLGKIGDKSALPALNKALDSGSEWQANMVEQEAAVAISRIERGDNTSTK